jgi:hypothetical protein
VVSWHSAACAGRSKAWQKGEGQHRVREVATSLPPPSRQLPSFIYRFAGPVPSEPKARVL